MEFLLLLNACSEGNYPIYAHLKRLLFIQSSADCLQHCVGLWRHTDLLQHYPVDATPKE